jgi:hypothetical protein
VRKPDRLKQVERRRVYNVLVHHPMMQVVDGPHMVALVIKPDRRADRGNGHAPRVGGAGWGMFIVDVLAPPLSRMTIAVTVCACLCPCPRRLPLFNPPTSFYPEVLLDQHKPLRGFLPLFLDPKRPARWDDGRGTGSGSPTSISERCWRYRRSGSSAGRFARTCQ